MDTEELTIPYDQVSLEEQMLTTIDNPYDPFTEWDDWFAYDEQKGYHTCGLLARMALTSVYLTEEENIIEINHAINNILELFPGMYRTVKRS